MYQRKKERKKKERKKKDRKTGRKKERREIQYIIIQRKKERYGERKKGIRQKLEDESRISIDACFNVKAFESIWSKNIEHFN